MLSNFFSLLVSPNPSQPWLAVSTSNPKELQIYDYSSKRHFRNHLELCMNNYSDLSNIYTYAAYKTVAGKEKVVASFTPNGE